ncbi:HAD family hydrolase, partial [Atopobiaceae bacterium LCP21S3_F7]
MAGRTGRATVFFDIDGTLGWNDPACPEALPEWERGLSPGPSPAVARAIRSLVARGNLAFLCTGRSPHDVHPALRELPFSGMVALSGAYVTLGGEVLRDRPMPGPLVRAADRALARAGFGMVLECVGGKAEVRG